MKKTIFTFLVIMFTAFLLNAQALYFVGGYVTNLNGGAISNHNVYVWSDSTSSYSYYNTVVTNDNGYYSLSINDLPGSGTLVTFHVATYDCQGAIHEINITNTNPQNTVNFSICNNDATNSCQAGFYFYQDSLNVGSNAYHFINTSTTTYTGYTISYSWSFGDGTTSADVNPTHEFTAGSVGTYNVCLTMKVKLNDSVICDNSSCATIQVGNTSNPCQNSFTFTSQGLTYTFHGNINSSNPTTYHWSFGDGTAAEGQFVTHTFTLAPSGTSEFTICLVTASTDSNSSVCHDTTCQSITMSSTSGTIIQGYVYAGNEVAHSGYVELYQAGDSTMAYSLFATIPLDSSGYFAYNYVSVPPVTPTFIIKAFLNTTSPQYPHYFPTFFVSTLNWYNAATVTPSSNSEFHYIYLVAIPTNPTGDGTIGGNVSGNGKSIAVSGAEVILMDATNNPLAYKLTDASGNYSFTNLALGTYKVVVEILGKNCTIATITISTGNQNANSTNFIVTGANITASVEESIWFTNHISDVYPNPSNGNASIDFSLLKSNKISIKIYNNLGQLLLTNDNEYSIGSHKVKLNTNQLSVGIYTIEISAENSTRIIKKFVKTK